MLSPEELRAFPWSVLSWLIVNEGELQTLLEAFGSSVSTDDGNLIQSCTDGIAALHKNEHFSSNVSVICTLGAQGILYFQPGEGGPKSGHLPAGKLSKPVKDTTGAGDCFAGYFAAGLMRSKEGESLEEVLQDCLTVSLDEDKSLIPGLRNLRREPRCDGERPKARRCPHTQRSIDARLRRSNCTQPLCQLSA